ncbi:MAG: hypothetical protein IFK94_10625 [Acidobacteria bacterium]|uniref:Uncharacterized protein n=1 Tax=Candidatus Polarisedimenticola svalbardensis TaxID=2886004 RepID=A0A8J7C2V8_9BACT|nr:hypothetical protein [Candidatus Polarisedimenticola svalbardensis]
MRVHFFAYGHHEFMEKHLAEPVSRCLAEGHTQQGELEDGTRFVILNGVTDQQPPEQSEAVIVSCGDLRLPPEKEYTLEMYARESVHGGAGNTYRAVLSDHDIALGPNSTTLRWVHACQSVNAGEGCTLWGRVSAGERLTLDKDTVFERLNAPCIEFGEPVDPLTPAREGERLDPGDVPHLIDDSAGRWLVKGKLDIPDNRRVEANLVVTGGGRIGDGTTIKGSIKSHKDLYLGRGVKVDGSVVSQRDIYLDEGCRIRGPILAERVVHIQRGCVLGSPEQATTVSARRARVAPGVVAYGTFWAHEEGHVMVVPRKDG